MSLKGNVGLRSRFRLGAFWNIKSGRRCDQMFILPTLRIVYQSLYQPYPAHIVVDFDCGGRHRQRRGSRVRTDVIRYGLFLCSPDDASARLVPDQPRPVVREAEMRRHPVRSPRSLGFSI
jgi:hypothetical protein